MRRSLIRLTLLSYVVIICLAGMVGLKIDYWRWVQLTGPSIISVGLASHLAARFKFERMRLTVDALLFNSLFLFPIGGAVFIAMKMNFPLADSQLAAMDRAIGFDWPSVIHYIDSRPWLAHTLEFSYLCFTPQLFFCPLFLGILGKSGRMYQMLASYAAIVFVSSLVAVRFPAVGEFAATDTKSLTNIDTWLALSFVDPLLAVRNNPDFALSPDRLSGIIAFPSVHAAIAVLAAWSLWEIRWLRYPMLILNFLMAASAIPYGSHYFVDILAGLAIGGTVTACAHYFYLSKPSPSRPNPAIRPPVAGSI